MENALNPGDVLGGRYRIEAKIGEGGMGEVYRALDERNLNRPVAVKFINPKTIRKLGAKAIKRFLREKEAYVRITHPNVVTIFDSGTTEDGSVYLVQEYIVGESLDRILKRKNLFTKTDILSIVGQIAAALDAIHSEGIIHRDLKPSNVMLQTLSGGTKQVKIIDFGIAKVDESVVGTALTVEGSSLGTPWYAAPEQLTGAPPSRMMDLWALSVITYQLVAGVPPFREPTVVLIERKQRAGSIPPSRYRPDFPKALDVVLLKALSYDPTDRYPTVQEFQTALSLAFASSGGFPAQQIDPNESDRTLLGGDSPPPVRNHKTPMKVKSLSGPSAEPHRESSGDEPTEESQATNRLRDTRLEAEKPIRDTIDRKNPETEPVRPFVAPALSRTSFLFFGIAVLVAAGVFLAGRYAFQPSDTIPQPPIVAPTRLLLEYRLLVDDKRGKPAFATGRELYRSGDRFKFLIRPRESGFLYLFNESPDGRMVCLFPPPYSETKESRVPGGVEISLPNEWFQFDPVEGAERLVVVFSTRPVLTLERLYPDGVVAKNGLVDPAAAAAVRAWMKSAEKPVKQDNPDYETVLSSTDDPLVGKIMLQHR